MTIHMNDDSVVSVAQLRELVKLSECAKFEAKGREDAYAWVEKILRRFRYFRESKKNRGVVKSYVKAMTGYSETQVDRLIRRKKETGKVVLKKRTQPTFPAVYTPEDVTLLAEVDNAEGRRTGAALRKTCADMYALYGDRRFERLSRISVSHIYNLRGRRVYESRSLTHTKTSSVSTPIGVRKKPRPGGRPGYLRVDSVHQGDRDKEKGVYHVNLVDEVTQWEIILCVEGISEYFLLPALQGALAGFPFRVLGFHSDNGSEYVNKVVAYLLQKLLVEQTKSRSRRTNDNALVEGKNGAIIRKHMGHAHIPKRYAAAVDAFYRDHFNPYLNFHRQSAFPTITIDGKGKVRKVYETYLTPCEKLLSIQGVEHYLVLGVTPESLKTEMMKMTHLAAAKKMQEAKVVLFTQISRRMVR